MGLFYPLITFWLLILTYLFGELIPVANAYETLLLALAAGQILKLIIKRKYTLAKTPADVALLLFLLLVLVSLFVGQDFFMTNQATYTKNIIYLILLYFLAVNLLDTAKKVKNTIIVMLFGAMVVSAYGIFQYFTGCNLIGYFQAYLISGQLWYLRRVQSLLGSPNSLGTYLILILPSALILLLNTPGPARFFLIAINILLVTCLALSFSIGAWISLSAGIILTIFFIPLEHKVLRRLPYFLVFIIIALVFWVGLTHTQFNLLKIKLNNICSRGHFIWPVIVRSIISRPLFGAGCDLYSLDYNPADIAIEARQHAHNGYLQVLVDFGIIGGIICLWIYLSILATYRKIQNSLLQNKAEPENKTTIYLACGLWIGLVSFFVNLMVENFFYSFWPFLNLSLLAASINIIRKENKEIFPDRSDFSKTTKIIGTGLLILIFAYFLTGLFCNPEISLEKRFAMYKKFSNLTDNGWYKTIPGLRQPPVLDSCWMANYSAITVDNHSPNSEKVILESRVASFLFPRTLEVFLNGQFLGQEKITSTTTNKRYQLFTLHLTLSTGTNTITFGSPEGVDSPHFMAVRNDNRWISFNFKRSLNILFLKNQQRIYPLESLFHNIAPIFF